MAATKRRPGRRVLTKPEAVDKHQKLILEAREAQEATEKQLEADKQLVARRCDAAMSDGVETNAIATWLGLSRQMIYKIVRERIDKKPLGKPAKPLKLKGKKIPPKKTRVQRTKSRKPLRRPTAQKK